MALTRRQVLALSGAGAVGVAGCIGDDHVAYDGEADVTPDGDDASVDDEEAYTVSRLFEPASFGCDSIPDPDEDCDELPMSDRGLPIPDCPESLEADVVSGGPGQDGIPSIDEPEFEHADDVGDRLSPADPVFGIQVNGETKAYPQSILVWHEIVNDTVGGESLAVTYCPLTGTAQTFERGEITFGVSGRLLNSNLIMFDRKTGSWWPQMLAISIDGPLTGAYLVEHQMTWTTWDRWQSAHPDTQVLTEETGYARDYNHDPYGSYNPLGGFYASQSKIFDPYVEDPEDLLHPKEVVLGTRTDAGAFAVTKARLEAERVVHVDVDGTYHLAVYDDTLETGYVYHTPADVSIEADGNTYSVDGSSYDPDSLPFDRVIAFDAFWFAWIGYFPTSVVVH